MAVKGYICSSKTKRRIYQVAADLFLRDGFQNTTLNDIAKAADVSTGTLYRYYPSKGDFLMEIGKNSVDHLKAYAQSLPEDMPVREAVLAILLEDISGTQKIFFSSEDADEDVTELQANDIRLAYSYEIYASRDHLDTELATRAELVSIYAAVIQRAKEEGELTGSFDSRTFSQIIVAIFFQELDKGMYRYDYPYELKFREKLDILFEGRVHKAEASE
ncbi:MAG: TetR/AcrR family transcriptional regulator [Gordonibacter pamelaeae]|uniref:TetR/AcrR family transcriptional regulator n=1 Tax=Gordonibacter massiliensis (ex Traore et al. 2017) TaxID=1841863 RepID=UPI001C8B16AC|nr:TetR/AcrR family transcriptional regulator [Gordonibacter massiliensis (ex Traore et al. 2017)]MBX9034462.1 TetR family transcriptional regulator [Gordonibacter massiliensis (ex Traore et al. 2017)]